MLNECCFLCLECVGWVIHRCIINSLDLWMKAAQICLHNFTVGLTCSSLTGCFWLAARLGTECLTPPHSCIWDLAWNSGTTDPSLFAVFHLGFFTLWWASPKGQVVSKPPWFRICWHSLVQSWSYGAAESQCGKWLYKGLDARTLLLGGATSGRI